MWELTQWNNEIAGRTSERTETWDSWRMISGVILVLVGVGFGCWTFGLVSQRNNENIERTTVAVNREATQLALGQQLDVEFADVIRTLRERATIEVQVATGRELGLAVRGSMKFYYGVCERSEAFYLFIENYEGSRDLVYSSGTLCQPTRLSYSSPQSLGDSTLGGEWFQLSYFSEFLSLDLGSFLSTPTRTPRPSATATERPADGKPTATPVGGLYQ